MTVFKPGDRVRLMGIAAYEPPDRRNKIGTVLRAWTDPTSIARLDVRFDGEMDEATGFAAAHYAHAS